MSDGEAVDRSAPVLANRHSEAIRNVLQALFHWIFAKSYCKSREEIEWLTALYFINMCLSRAGKELPREMRIPKLKINEER